MGITNNSVTKFVKEACGLPRIGACSKGYWTTPGVYLNASVSLDKLIVSNGCGYPFVDTNSFWVNTFTASGAGVMADFWLLSKDLTLLKSGKVVLTGSSDNGFVTDIGLSGLIDWKSSYGTTGNTCTMGTSAIDSLSNIYTTVTTSNTTTGWSGGLVKLNSSGTLIWNKGKAASSSGDILLVSNDNLVAGLAVSSLDNILVVYTNNSGIAGPGPYDYLSKDRLCFTIYDQSGTIVHETFAMYKTPDVQDSFDDFLVENFSPNSWDVYYVLNTSLIPSQVIATDKLGNFYITGTKITSTWDSLTNIITDTNIGGFLTQITSSGTIGLNKLIPDFYPTQITEDNVGDIYLLGVDSSNNHFIIKVNHLTFAIIWQHSFPSISTNDYLSVSVDCNLDLFFSAEPATGGTSVYFKMSPTGTIYWSKLLTVAT